MEKQKRQQHYLSSFAIVILWALIQSFGWMIIYLLAVNLNIRPHMFTLGFVGLLGGGLMGALQHTLIDRGIGISLRHWLLLTAIGTAVGFILTDYIVVRDNSLYMVVLPVFVVPAIFQWISVRSHTKVGFLWIVGHVITAQVFVMFYEFLVKQQVYEMPSAMIPAALQGIASGFIMVWLLRQLSKQDLTHEKPKIEYDSKVNVA